MVSDRRVSDINLLNSFVKDFVDVLETIQIKYIIVSGFVAISHGRSRGTEDIDIIIEKISEKKFESMHIELIKSGFECLQGNTTKDLFNDYLKENTSIRYVKKGSFVPEMELKMAKDELDENQLNERVKLPLTGLPFWFSSIETNIAFKEELLKSPKDLEDSRHLRIIYENKLNEGQIKEIKRLIRKYRLIIK
ncbi:MAG: hypothetical protein NTY48_00270 [Candidatus Diapherotrites archaeon]|nr:hypothetical protein [Candidatus Diapherotrites archaeon]